MAHLAAALAPLLLPSMLAPAVGAAAAGGKADAGGPGRALGTLAGAGGESVAFSRDGRLILTTGPAAARVWDAATLRPVTPPLPYRGGDWGENGTGSAEFSPDGTLVVTTTGRDARLFDARTGKELRVFEHDRPPPAPRRDDQPRHRMGAFPEGVWAAAFSPDGKRLATGGDDRLARVWDLATGRQVLAIRHRGPVVAAAFSPDGATLLTSDESAWLWDAATGRRLQTERMSAVFRKPAFSPDGKYVMCRSGDAVSVYRAADGKYVLGDSTKDGMFVDAAAFSPDGRSLLVTSDGEARAWDLPADDARRGPPAEPRKVGGPDDFARLAQAVYSPDGKRILTCDLSLIVAADSRGTAVWDAATGVRLMTVGGCENPAAGTFSPDGRRVAVACTRDARGGGKAAGAGPVDNGYTVVWQVGPPAGDGGRR